MKNCKLFATLLLCCLLLGGCATVGSVPVASPSAAPTPPPPDTFTLRVGIDSLPENWNIHSWETAADEYVWLHTEMPFVDTAIARDEYGNEISVWRYEMARSVEDVTADWPGCADWGIQPGETGRVWRIRLNPDACWDDPAATPITADSYLYSMHRMLDPSLQNYRASAYTEGPAAILGAEDYARSGLTRWKENTAADGTIRFPFSDWIAGTDGQYLAPDGTPLFFSLTAPITYWTSGYSLLEYREFGFLPPETFDALSALSTEDGYVPVTDESIALLHSFTGSAEWGREAIDELAHYVSYLQTFPTVDWSSVGLLREDDETLIYVCAAAISEFDFLSSLTTNWLVCESLYEGGMHTVDDCVFTTYGTAPEQYAAYGPYRISELASDHISFEQNPNWYGYHDGRHTGEYQTTHIKAYVLSGHEEAMQRFEADELDLLSLTEADALQYLGDPRLLTTDESYVYRIFMVTDHDTLAALQADASTEEQPVNKTCLSNADFRKGMSFAIDRAAYAAEATPGYRPALGIYNELYVCDPAADYNRSYRSTEAAQAALERIYRVPDGHTETAAPLTGYDPEYARDCFRQAYHDMCASGDWTPGMTIVLDCAVTATGLTELHQRQQALLQAYLDEALTGTGFSGCLTLRFVSRPELYDAVENGEIEMGIGAWGGAPYYPYHLLQCYCDPSYTGIQELCGFDPTREQVTVSIDGAEVTRSFQAWSRALITGGEFAELDTEQKTRILAAVESALLEQRRFLVLCSRTSLSLHSERISFPAERSHLLGGFGGVRGITYAESDAAWAARQLPPTPDPASLPDPEQG